MTSLREWIETKIGDKDIKYFKYEEFSNRRIIGEGGASVVYKADWNGRGMKVAALRSPHNSHNSRIDEGKIKEFVKELKLLRTITYNPNINQFLGVTKDPIGNYVMVLQYANQGNLRDYLNNKKIFDSLQWSDKIQMALDIVNGLMCLHHENIIHGDLHSKNILVNDNKLMIADFGFSKQLTEIPSNSRSSRTSRTSTTNSIIPCGMPAYVDPLYFKDSDNYKRDQKSDIYSLGVLLWEITSGRPPFVELNRNQLYYRISTKSPRETPIDNTPLDYTQLYQNCWSEERNQRPEINEVYKILNDLQIKCQHLENLPSSVSSINKSNISTSSELIDNNNKFELSAALDEIFQGYLKNNNTGRTKYSDFNIILEKYRPQSKYIIHYLISHPTIQHRELMIGTLYKMEGNQNERFKWFMKANEKGDKYSHFELGECFYHGYGTEKNYEKALKYYKDAIDNEVTIALYTLAGYYEVDGNNVMAYRLHKKAAENGFVASQCNLFKYYDNGIGTTKNKNKALNWYNLYLENSGLSDTSNESILNIDIMELNAALDDIFQGYLKNNNTGWTKHFDFNIILEKYRPQSKYIIHYLIGHPTIQHRELMIGTLYKMEGNQNERFKWFMEARKKDDVNSYFELGECFYYGFGTVIDHKKSWEFYQPAIRNGLNIALYNIAVRLIKFDAYNLYKKSAKNGFVPSQYDLAICYDHGIGTQVNKSEASYWYNLYQKNGGLRDIPDILNWNIPSDTSNKANEVIWYISSDTSNKSNKLDSKRRRSNLRFYLQNSLFNPFKSKLKEQDSNRVIWDVNQLELKTALREICQGYLKNNNIGWTKNFDFDIILKKYRPQSKDLFQYVMSNPTIKHRELMIGTLFKIERNQEEMFNWYMKASNKGDADGYFELGECYNHGFGTKKDHEKALSYYMRAILSKELNIALYSLAVVYEYTGNKHDAYKLYERAAKNGFVSSQYELAKCYSHGMGTQVNKSEALNWYKLYKKNGGLVDVSNQIKINQ